MFRFASPVTLRLACGEHLSWHQGRVQLRVLSGAAWVTRPNDRDDHILTAGQTLDLSHGLIGAEQDVLLSFESPGAGWLRAGVTWLSRAARRLASSSIALPEAACKSTSIPQRAPARAMPVPPTSRPWCAT